MKRRDFFSSLIAAPAALVGVNLPKAEPKKPTFKIPGTRYYTSEANGEILTVVGVAGCEIKAGEMVWMKSSCKENEH